MSSRPRVEQGREHQADDRHVSNGRERSLGPLFLMCYDDNRKHTIEEKIADALDAYRVRFGIDPTLVWVNVAVPQDVVVANVVIERRVTIAPNTIWVGLQTTAADARNA